VCSYQPGSRSPNRSPSRIPAQSAVGDCVQNGAQKPPIHTALLHIQGRSFVDYPSILGVLTDCCSDGVEYVVTSRIDQLVARDARKVAA
jgi:hypothetical protein